MTTITGNTYPVREQIKALGGRWNRIMQGWDVADSVADRCREIVAGAGPVTARTYDRPVVTRFSSGASTYRNARGRCEDAPCCGCCS